LGIRPPLDVAELCRLVGEQRGRTIHVIGYPMPVPGPFGIWIATNRVDYILHQQHTSRAHQNHIILHELGHILAGHHSHEADDALPAKLYPDLDPGVVHSALMRTSYDDEYEREAETIATIILEWASVLDRVTLGRSHQPAAQRMDTALGDRQGWL
jgi:hypothetical protein